MRQEVHNCVKHCIVCQQAKTANTHPGGLLQPLSIPQHIREDIDMDFILGLPMSKGIFVIFVIVDRLSKCDHFLSLKVDFTSSLVAKVSIHSLIKLHGIPRSIKIRLLQVDFGKIFSLIVISI